jgi:hypothetical protein
MLGASGLVAVAVLAVGLSVADIARVVRQQSPVPGAGGRAVPAQVWTPQPFVEDPADRERDRNDAYLRRDLRLERRLDAERRMERDRPGWPGH